MLHRLCTEDADTSQLTEVVCRGLGVEHHRHRTLATGYHPLYTHITGLLEQFEIRRYHLIMSTYEGVGDLA